MNLITQHLFSMNTHYQLSHTHSHSHSHSHTGIGGGVGGGVNLGPASTNNTCNNCGKQGHSFYQCKLPIISYGIILFKPLNIQNVESNNCLSDNNPAQVEVEDLYQRRFEVGHASSVSESKLSGNLVENSNGGPFEFFNGVNEKKKCKKVPTENVQDYQFLMIRRKDSFGYIDLIRGKYSPNNIEQVQGIINEMSELEKEKILNHSFRELWKMMWGDNVNNQYKNEEIHSAKKFEMLKNGVFVEETGEYITLLELVNQSTTGWKETEWEFPKGRRNNKEKDLECALREFEEETGISQKQINVVENVLPFEETFIGTNYKSYKHKYFLAFIQEEDDLNNQPFVHFQPSEVSKMEWKTLDECLESIRPYHLEKKQLIQNVYKVLKEYRLFILS